MMGRPTARALTGAVLLAFAGCGSGEQTAATPTPVVDNTATGAVGTRNLDPEPRKHVPETRRVERDLDPGREVDLQPTDAPPVTNPEPAKKPEKPAPIDGNLGDGVSVDLTPAAPAPTRARRRMNVDQLDAAIRRVSGGIGWTTGAGWQGKTVGSNNFEQLAATLGKPNYTDLTTEDLDAGALFQKFLGDAASSVCGKLSARELTVPTSADRVLMRFVEPTDTATSNKAGIDANLAYLMLRYHGRKVAADSPELEGWRFLFESATKVSKSPVTAWRAVCVGLMQHPRFFTY